MVCRDWSGGRAGLRRDPRALPGRARCYREDQLMGGATNPAHVSGLHRVNPHVPPVDQLGAPCRKPTRLANIRHIGLSKVTALGYSTETASFIERRLNGNGPPSK
jgi:hypothetical protein